MLEAQLQAEFFQTYFEVAQAHFSSHLLHDLNIHFSDNYLGYLDFRKENRLNYLRKVL